jgi:arabinose-5-phosphate isomerase
LSNLEQIIENARESIGLEAKAVKNLIERVDLAFANSVKTILQSPGRVIVTGIGKSAAIAQKIVGTLNSTGTPAIFMHAADAVHGDLGIIQKDDVVICLSKSGNTPEIKVLVPLLRRGGNKLIAIVGDTNSFLAQQSDFVLDATVEREACPNNLAPTTSTTVQLVFGDALAVCLLKERKFSKEDFAKYHPGGALGKRLYLTLGEMAERNAKPRVKPEDPIKTAIIEITKNRMGAAAVIANGTLQGIITDGDLRRMLEKFEDIGGLRVMDIMGKNPVTMDENTLAIDGAELMAEIKVSQIIVLKNEKYAGMVHIHDLNSEGII